MLVAVERRLFCKAVQLRPLPYLLSPNHATAFSALEGFHTPINYPISFPFLLKAALAFSCFV
jgi:hypothetical protein